ncbi:MULTISPECIES: hypothetical protein [unclassified Methylocaldum]|jgi:hypothetical protein|uniref:hypothetical protein n=1 Tax=unclassified Methylocaldum TaxID=2622260 RepID=UPI000A3289D6|nr:hypothetical protein [Methylocaldum sp. RMAD-M]MBP1153123.1 hypothetical protein [Methylocaldum sp. RMAD-M]MVF23975.1 hypothetical protein [Methylocaldum sp. BRCS4]
MIKLGNHLRLTQDELKAFRAMTGVLKPPQTVEEHNAALEKTASAWRDEDEGPASRLLQAVLLAERIPKE